MKELFNADLRAFLSLDDDERIRYIDHTLYWTSTRETPLQVSIDYSYQIADLLHVSTEQLKGMHQQVSYLYPMEQEVEYRLSEEKQIFNSTTVGFYQTYLNVPVWQAGFTVTMKNGPYRIVGAVNTSQEGLEAKLPAQQRIEYYRRLFNLAQLQNEVRKLQMEEKDRFVETTTFVRSLIDRRKLHKNRKGVRKGKRDEQDNARLIRGRFYVYRYNERDRLPVRPQQITTSNREGEEEKPDILTKSDTF